MRAWLERGEIMMAADLKRDKPLREAFILALGDTVEKGKEALKRAAPGAAAQVLRTLELATYVGHEDSRVAVDAGRNRQSVGG